MSGQPVTRPTICQVVYTLNVGGAEILAREFALGCADFRFVFACLDENGVLGQQLQASNYPITVLQRRPGFDWTCVMRLAAFCRKEGVQLLHAHQYGPFFYSQLASRLAGQIPVLFTEHGRDYPDFRRGKRIWANRLLLRRRDRVVAVGECVRQALIHNEGFPPERIEVICNGIDTQKFAAARTQRDAVRVQWGLTPTLPVIVQVARLNRLKDHVTAIKSMVPLSVTVPDARLILVGDGEERPHLEHLVAELGLGRQVCFLGTQHDVASLYGAADVALLSSISEGIPLTLLEAMAAGLPCVGTRVGGIPEVIVDGVTGVLANPSDPHELAAALQRLLLDAPFARALGEAGKQRVREQFEAQRMHAAYRRMFHELIPDSRGAAMRTDALSTDP